MGRSTFATTCAPRNVREVVREFDGFAGSAKQKTVLDTCGYFRTDLSSLVNCDGIQPEAVQRLLAAMQTHSKTVKPKRLGLIGRDHIEQRFTGTGCDMKTFNYKKVLGEADNGLPYVI